MTGYMTGGAKNTTDKIALTVMPSGILGNC